MTGRPSEFTQEVADGICERLAAGESLRSICANDDMPGQTTVFRWLNANSDFREQYARAREVQADTLFDDILDIADNARNDWMERRGEDDAGWVANGENIRRSQVRIEARKWMAGKLRPKVYGDKLDIDLSNKVNFVINAKPMSEADWLKEHGSDDDK